MDADRQKHLKKSGATLDFDAIKTKKGIAALSDDMVVFWFDWLQVKVEKETGKPLIPEYMVQQKGFREQKHRGMLRPGP